jgi:capsid protein
VNRRPDTAERLRQNREARKAQEAAKLAQPLLAAEAAKAAHLARLDKIVDNSSDKNRNFFIAYLGLLIYVQAGKLGCATHCLC